MRKRKKKKEKEKKRIQKNKTIKLYKILITLLINCIFNINII